MQYGIHVDLAPLAAAIDKASVEVFGAVNVAVRMTAGEIQNEWQQQIYHALPIRDSWTQERNRAAVDSIKTEDTGPFSSTISSNHPAVLGIEQGAPARDMKQMLQTSTRTKVSKQGEKYLTIPFRHNTPGQGALAPAMPTRIHNQASQLSPSTVTGKGLRVGANGDVAPKLKYLWGGRLPAGLAPKLRPSHKTDPYAGMTRFNTGSGKQRSSAYLTFRVMHQGATGWIVQAKPGLFIARDLAQQGQRVLSDRIGDILRSVGA